jgi:hypothetical protein
LVIVAAGNMQVMRIWRSVIATATVLVVAACAQPSQRRDAAADVAARLLTAVQDTDGAAACAVLTPGTVAGLEQSSAKPCAEAVLEQDLPGPSPVDRVDVYGQWARVQMPTDTMFLAIFPGGWRVAAAGCSAQAGRPYDCLLQDS